jgi:phosphatidylglycerol:prolipoprotein diacylglycerol transferase
MHVPFYNLLNGLGLIAVILLLERDFNRQGPNGRFPAFLTVVGLAYLFGWLSAHAWDVWVHRDTLAGEPFFSHSRAGYSFMGGLVGGALFLGVGLRVVGFDVWVTLDLIAPLIPLGHAFGRIGCFVAGCCYGRTVSAWGHSLRIPVQLLSTIALFGLFCVLHRRRTQVNRAYLYVLGYSAIRFGEEFLRGDDRGRSITSVFSPAQEISIVLLVGCSGLWVLSRFPGRRFGGLHRALTSAASADHQSCERLETPPVRRSR